VTSIPLPYIESTYLISAIKNDRVKPKMQGCTWFCLSKIGCADPATLTF